MFKYLAKDNFIIKKFVKNFAKKQRFVSIFEKWKTGKTKEEQFQPTPGKDINKTELKYQNESGLFENLDKDKKIPENINYTQEEGIFEEISTELKKGMDIEEKQKFGTNVAYLLGRFGERIGETRTLLTEKLNSMDLEGELKPKLKRLNELGFSDSQITTMLHKE
jgi:hypothetical protein